MGGIKSEKENLKVLPAKDGNLPQGVGGDLPQGGVHFDLLVAHSTLLSRNEAQLFQFVALSFLPFPRESREYCRIIGEKCRIVNGKLQNLILAYLDFSRAGKEASLWNCKRKTERKRSL